MPLKMHTFFHENTLEIVISKTSAILSRLCCVKLVFFMSDWLFMPLLLISTNSTTHFLPVDFQGAPRRPRCRVVWMSQRSWRYDHILILQLFYVLAILVQCSLMKTWGQFSEKILTIGTHPVAYLWRLLHMGVPFVTSVYMIYSAESGARVSVMLLILTYFARNNTSLVWVLNGYSCCSLYYAHEYLIRQGDYFYWPTCPFRALVQMFCDCCLQN